MGKRRKLPELVFPEVVGGYFLLINWIFKLELFFLNIEQTVIQSEINYKSKLITFC